MSLFHVVHAQLIHDVEQGYQSWLRKTNKEKEIWHEELLEDNNETRLRFLDCVGFAKQPKPSIFKRFFWKRGTIAD